MGNWNSPFQHPPGPGLVICWRFSNQNNLWVRFSPPHMCYLADNENELVSLMRQLTTDQILFKVTMKGGEWAETTLAKPQEKSESGPGLSVRFVSWSGKFDR